MLELTPEGGKCWLTRQKSFGYVCQLAFNVENIKFEPEEFKDDALYEVNEEVNDQSEWEGAITLETHIATTQPTTQNNLKQLLLGWYYYR